MIYLFNKDMTLCEPFTNQQLKIKGNKIYVCNNFFVEYMNYDDCIKVMDYLKKQIDLGYKTFIFPNQKKVNLL